MRPESSRKPTSILDRRTSCHHFGQVRQSSPSAIHLETHMGTRPPKLPILMPSVATIPRSIFGVPAGLSVTAFPQIRRGGSKTGKSLQVAFALTRLGWHVTLSPEFYRPAVCTTISTLRFSRCSSIEPLGETRNLV